MRTRRGYRPELSALEARLSPSAAGLALHAPSAHARVAPHRTHHALHPRAHHSHPRAATIHAQVMAGGAFTPGQKILPMA